MSLTLETIPAGTEREVCKKNINTHSNSAISKVYI